MGNSMKIDEFEFGSSIPVLRMLNELDAKAFYLDFLGYQVDWEHRFDASVESPLYLQIHLGESVIHLNGHADASTPTSEIRIPMHRLDEFAIFLHDKNSRFGSPMPVDPRGSGKNTDLNLEDPSGNALTFWSHDD